MVLGTATSGLGLLHWLSGNLLTLRLWGCCTVSSTRPSLKVAGCVNTAAGAHEQTAQIVSHLRNYTGPIFQRYIVRLIFMVPLYSILSFLSLMMPTKEVCVCPQPF